MIFSFSSFHVYFYPRPPRGGRPSRDVDGQRVIGISIHALREEGDDEQFVLLLSHGISIHALREEGDSNFLLSENSADDISIHALREEGDSHAHSHSGWSHHFYPRPPRGGRPQLPAPFCREQAISIHALREEGDIGGPYMYIYCEISIHALREEGDYYVPDDVTYSE